MKKVLFELFENTGQLDLEAITLRMTASVIIAFFIFLSYMLSHEGSIYSKKFNVSKYMERMLYPRGPLCGS